MSQTTLATKTFHGTRAVLVNGAGAQLGMFDSIETGVDQDHFEPFILGRASPGEIVLMGQAPIMVRLSGYRKIGEGPYSNAGFTMNTLQSLMSDNVDWTVLVYDRQLGVGGDNTNPLAANNATSGAFNTNQIVIGVYNAKVVRHNLSVAAKQPSRLVMELVGETFSDTDGGPQSEIGTAY